jgi:hypothetical protein
MKMSPYPFTIVEELAGISSDYIPDMKPYMVGNYESVSSGCAPGYGELLTEKAVYAVGAKAAN